jgi:hypothetical protein
MQPGTTLIADEKYAGQNMIVLWRIGEHTFALFDPSQRDLLTGITSHLPPDTSLSGDQVKQACGLDAIASHDLDFIHYLPPSDLPALTVPPPFRLRELTPADEGYLSALHRSCTPAEVDDGYVEIDHEIVFGCFHEHELVSAASGYRMAGFMDIGVLTHSHFRKSGLARIVVGALCAWSIANNIIPQYRCNHDNTGSLGVARSLHFQPYFRSEVIIIN